MESLQSLTSINIHPPQELLQRPGHRCRNVWAQGTNSSVNGPGTTGAEFADWSNIKLTTGVQLHSHTNQILGATNIQLIKR